ncbi:MAG: nucleoside deaminase [Bacilli bacterium]|nr:nucleoside deaminase [Bacilli bacterium]
MNEFFDKAIMAARVGVQNSEGGPFGAVVVDKDNKIVGIGNNKVLMSNDPTAHAEVVAIRDACSKLKTYDLSGCKIIATSEPCPMCLSSIIWANIREVYYGTTRVETSSIGFRDDLIYRYFEGKDKSVVIVKHLENTNCNKLIDEYKNTIY